MQASGALPLGGRLPTTVQERCDAPREFCSRLDKRKVADAFENAQQGRGHLLREPLHVRAIGILAAHDKQSWHPEPTNTITKIVRG